MMNRRDFWKTLGAIAVLPQVMIAAPAAASAAERYYWTRAVPMGAQPRSRLLRLSVADYGSSTAQFGALDFFEGETGLARLWVQAGYCAQWLCAPEQYVAVPDRIELHAEQPMNLAVNIMYDRDDVIFCRTLQGQELLPEVSLNARMIAP